MVKKNSSLWGLLFATKVTWLLLLLLKTIDGASAFLPPNFRSSLPQMWSSSLMASASHASRQHDDGADDQKMIPTDNVEEKAYPQQTPHSGRHFWPSHPMYNNSTRSTLRRKFSRRQRRRKRFLEGWYYRLSLVEENLSFAFILSIEDPGIPSSDLKLACIQVVGPDGYLVQGSRNDTKFWAWEGRQGLGYTFQYKDNVDEESMKLRTALSLAEWREKVKAGFQVLPNHIIGRVEGHDDTLGALLENQGVPGDCEFDMSVQPIVGWGGVKSTEQKSTAGWLASFAVFEPHWQVTLADARASGKVSWNNKTYEFENEPFYAEKNWGAAMPTKWYWTQCNSFDGYTCGKNQLSITAGGGIRKIPFGREESLGMVSVHYNGTFYEAVPWTGTMEWDVKEWGEWKLRGRCTNAEQPFEVEYISTCQDPGIVIRAPTVDKGMIPFARDSFEANASLTLWKLEWDKAKKKFVKCKGPPIIDGAKSSQGAVEVGGPWFEDWKGTSKMDRILKALVKLPYRFKNRFRKIKRKK